MSVRDNILYMPNVKCLGLDGVPLEVLKNVWLESDPVLIHAINNILKGGIPHS